MWAKKTKYILPSKLKYLTKLDYKLIVVFLEIFLLLVYEQYV